MTDQHTYLTHDGRMTWVQAEALPLTYAVRSLFTNTLMRSRLWLHLKLFPLDMLRLEVYFCSLINHDDMTRYDYFIKKVDGVLYVGIDDFMGGLVNSQSVIVILDTMIQFIADFGKDTCWPINGVKGSAAIEVVEYLKQLISKEVE